MSLPSLTWPGPYAGLRQRIVNDLALGGDREAAVLSLRPRRSIGSRQTSSDHLAPFLPGMPPTGQLSEVDRFLTYARYLWMTPDGRARTDLLKGMKVVLSLRQPTATTSNKGKGVYDDRMVILWTNFVEGFNVIELAANTEPSAQYDAAAGNSKFESMKSIVPKKPEGEDINDDGVRDMGRLQPGVYRFKRSKTKNHPEMFRIQVPPDGLRGRVMRDVNHTGKFDGDTSAFDKLNDSFLIHPGGLNNTYSAGCQTLPKIAPATKGFQSAREPWPTFWRKMSPQEYLIYVLVDVSQPYGGRMI